MIRSELVKYNYKLDQRPEIIVANKMDTDEAQLNMMEDHIKDYFKDKNIVFVSGLLKDNVEELLLRIAKELQTAKYIPLWRNGDIYDGVKVID